MAEVADVLGIPVPTAKTHAHRARLHLRKRLSTFMESEGAPKPKCRHVSKTGELDIALAG